jgi:hypothetical protein
MRRTVWIIGLVIAAGMSARAQEVPVVKNLTTARLQWGMPVADVAATQNRPAVGYFDYRVDGRFVPGPEAEITRLADGTVNGVAFAVWRAKLPAVLTEGRHLAELRSCKTGATNPLVDCSDWIPAPFEVDAEGNVRPSAPGNVTFITVGVTVNVTGRP